MSTCPWQQPDFDIIQVKPQVCQSTTVMCFTMRLIKLFIYILHSSIKILIVVKSPGCLFSRCARCQQTFTEKNQKRLCFSCLYNFFLYAEMLSQPASEQHKQHKCNQYPPLKRAVQELSQKGRTHVHHLITLKINLWICWQRIV